MAVPSDTPDGSETTWNTATGTTCGEVQPPAGEPTNSVLLTWRKSAASNPNGDCVELARLPAGEIAMRNSRDPRGPALIYTRAEIAAFLAGAKDGEFDDLAPMTALAAQPWRSRPMNDESQVTTGRMR